MDEITIADLQTWPSVYKSSRAFWDVLVGEDKALPLLEASSKGDIAALRSMLAPPWTKVILYSPHCIYMAKDRIHKDGKRVVAAMPIMNLTRAVFRAAEAGHATAVSLLLDFGAEHNLKPSSVIGCFETIPTTIKNGHVDAFQALVTADPASATLRLNYDTRPIGLALDYNQLEIMAILLRLGADKEAQEPSNWAYGKIMTSLLCQAARKAEGVPMMKLLLEYGNSVLGSGALHAAAESGMLDNMRFLIQHGADVNELLPQEKLPRHEARRDDRPARRFLLGSWTPLHFAASRGQDNAMELLENQNAQQNVMDGDGHTPSQLYALHLLRTAKKEANDAANRLDGS